MGKGLFGGTMASVFNNATNSLTSVITTLSNNRTDRNINRDTLQAEVMARTGLDTQASRYNFLTSASKDGSGNLQKMSGDATNMVVGMFGGKLLSGNGITAVSGADKDQPQSPGSKPNFLLWIVLGVAGFFLGKKLGWF